MLLICITRLVNYTVKRLVLLFSCLLFFILVEVHSILRGTLFIAYFITIVNTTQTPFYNASRSTSPGRSRLHLRTSRKPGIQHPPWKLIPASSELWYVILFIFLCISPNYKRCTYHRSGHKYLVTELYQCEMLYCLDTILKGALLTLLVGNNTFVGSHIQCETSSQMLQNAVHTTSLVTNTWSRSFISVRCCTVWIRF